MNELRTLDVQDVMARAASALSGASGRPIKMAEVQLLSDANRRNLVARVVAVDEEGKARSLIVKATRSPAYDPTAANALETSGLVKEWVATALLAERAPGRQHGCALVAGDIAAGILIFEDLGTGLVSLVDPLLKGTAEDAERALKLYATALARLHGDTVGCLDAHHAAFQSIFGSARPRRGPGWRVENDANLIASRIGGAPPANELELLSCRLSDPGPWLSLAHGDPCPDNSLLVDGHIRLIDYEWSRPAHALLDGIYWRMGFPTCWCAGRIPPDIAARVDAVYRTELGRSMPLALDDIGYHTELAYMSAVWLFTCLSWRLDRALGDDEKWGIWSIRGRLLWYLEAVIEMTGAAHVLPGINEAARGWLSELRTRWPDATPLGFYPAFAAEPNRSRL